MDMDLGSGTSWESRPASEGPLKSVCRCMRFGGFQLDRQRQELWKDGNQVKIQGKVYQALLALLESPGEIVTRETLRRHLWPRDSGLNYDANVNTTVNKLRLALGDSSEKPLYIETIPRKGYCLIVRPEFVDVPVTVAPVAPSSNPVNAKPQAEGSSSPRTDIWVTLGIIGLILGGMVLGAGITKLWISHFVPTPGGFWF